MPEDVLEKQKNVDPNPSAFEFAPTPSGRSLEIISISRPPLPAQDEEDRDELTFAPTPSGLSRGSGRPTLRRFKQSFKTTTVKPKTTSRSQSLADRLSAFTKNQE